MARTHDVISKTSLIRTITTATALSHWGRTPSAMPRFKATGSSKRLQGMLCVCAFGDRWWVDAGGK